MKLETELVGLAGEYFVAAQLCQRGLYAQLTLGNHKSVDILVESPRGAIYRVSVKTKTGAQWMKVRGIHARNELMVFVDLANHVQNPPVYVLSTREWRMVARGMARRKEDARFDSKTNTVFWPPSKGYPKGWHGCSVSVRDIQRFRGNWKAFGASG